MTNQTLEDDRAILYVTVGDDISREVMCVFTNDLFQRHVEHTV